MDCTLKPLARVYWVLPTLCSGRLHHLRWFWSHFRISPSFIKYFLRFAPVARDMTRWCNYSTPVMPDLIRHPALNFLCVPGLFAVQYRAYAFETNIPKRFHFPG